jgi:hypothetical protein
MSEVDCAPQLHTMEPLLSSKIDNQRQFPTKEATALPNGDHSSPQHNVAPSAPSNGDAPPQLPTMEPLATSNGHSSPQIPREDSSAVSNGDSIPEASVAAPSATPNGNGTPEASTEAVSLTPHTNGTPQAPTTTSSSTSNGDHSPQIQSMESSGGTDGDGSSHFPLHNKLLDHVVRTPGRQPSPQPTHLGVPGTSHSNNSRILHETGPGYFAPKFEGKDQQMEDGMRFI